MDFAGDGLGIQFRDVNQDRLEVIVTSTRTPASSNRSMYYVNHGNSLVAILADFGSREIDYRYVSTLNNELIQPQRQLPAERRQDDKGGTPHRCRRPPLIVPLDVLALLEALNIAERYTGADRWGGSDIVGGSPRLTGSSMSPETVTSEINMTLRSGREQSL